MQQLANVTTSDNYTAATTIELGSAIACKYVIANAAVYVQWAKHLDNNEVGPFGDEQLLTPEANVKRGVSGIRVRSAFAGVPAQVIAQLLDPDEADQDAGTPFTQYLAASGAIGVTFPLETGDIFYSGRAAVDRGNALVCDGRHLDAVTDPSLENLYNEIGITFGGTAKSDFALPDLRDRVPVGAGGNTARAANEGIAAANRHGTRHRHTPHSHTMERANNFDAPGDFINANGGHPQVDTGYPTASADGGSGVAADPLDGPAFLGLVAFIVK